MLSNRKVVFMIINTINKHQCLHGGSVVMMMVVVKGIALQTPCISQVLDIKDQLPYVVNCRGSRLSKSQSAPKSLGLVFT